jgi:hypothetical protein
MKAIHVMIYVVQLTLNLIRPQSTLEEIITCESNFMNRFNGDLLCYQTAKTF